MKQWKCDICGRPLKNKSKCYGHILCPKHMRQFMKYGHALDDIQRTNSDLNDYEIVDGNVVRIGLYNQKNARIATAIIDLDDLEDVRYHKWRLSHSHVITGSGTGNIRELSHVVLGVPKDKDGETIVDHINGNSLDNRKVNLRICSQAENVRNDAISITGVTYDRKRNAWASEIRMGDIRCHLPRRKSRSEAVWQRIVAEDILFGESVNKKARTKALACCEDMTEARKRELSECVATKVHEKFGK